jgi:hypothetical protein
MNHTFSRRPSFWIKNIGLKSFYRLICIIVLAGIFAPIQNGMAQTVNNVLNTKPTGAYVGKIDITDSIHQNFTLYIIAANNASATALFVFNDNNGIPTSAFSLNTDQGHYDHLTKQLGLIPVKWESEPGTEMKIFDDIGFHFEANPVWIYCPVKSTVSGLTSQASAKKDEALSAELQKQLDSGASVLTLSGFKLTLEPQFLKALHTPPDPMPPEGNISGIYEGSLDMGGDYCKLSLCVEDSGKATALLAYTDYVFLHPADAMAPKQDLQNAKIISVFSLNGAYDATTKRLQLNPDKWVAGTTNGSNFQMIPLSLTFNPYSSELSPNLHPNDGIFQMSLDEVLTSKLWQQTDKSPGSMLQALGLHAEQSAPTFSDPMFSERENKLMDASGNIVVPPNYDAPTTEEVRLALLRTMAKTSPDGRVIDPNSVRFSSAAGLLFKGYAVMRIDKVEFTSAPTPDAAGGFDCACTVNSTMSQSTFGGQLSGPKSSTMSGINRFELGPNGWWSPSAADRVTEQQTRSANQLNSNFRNFFHMDDLRR